MADICTLHLLHTNDLHSHFASLPRIVTCLRTHRQTWEQNNEHVLTVDIGDHLDRMNIITEASFGKINVELMNRSGYQYATIGNNEGITLPKKQLNHLYEHAAFTVVASNLLDPPDGRQPDWSVPYAIHEWGDLRVALLGATIPYPHSYQMMGWSSLEPKPILSDQVAALRAQVDVIVLMSHLGYQEDCRLAEEVEGIDVILGAHTHHLLEQGVRVRNTLIAQTGRFGQYVGHVRLVLDREKKTVMEATAEVFPTEQYPEDTQISQYLQDEMEAAETRLNRPIAKLAHDLRIDWEEETAFGSFLAASIREKTGAEVGLANGGLLLTDLKQGSLSRADLLRCVPHPLNLCAITLTGDQLTQVLEQAIQPQIVKRELRGCGFRGKVEGWMGVDGLRIEYVKEEHPRIVSIEVNGQKLEGSRRYRVGTVDMFMYNRLFPVLLQGSDVQFFLPVLLRELLAETLQNEEMIARSFSRRWIPVKAG